TERGGSETGNPVQINGGTLDDDTSAGNGSFLFDPVASTLTGSGANPGIASGQIVTLSSSGASVGLAKSLTNAGTLNVGQSTGSNGNVTLAGPSVTVTNTGAITTLPGTGGAQFLRTNIANASGGTVDIASGGTQSDGSGGATLFTNHGTLSVAGGATYALAGGSGFANLGGTITNNGALIQDSPGTFTERGGSETGNPVQINGGTLDDDTSAGAGNFLFDPVASSLTGTGTDPGIASGQIVTLSSSGASVALAKSLTNAGTLNIGQSATGSGNVTLAGPSVTVTNTGLITTLPGTGGAQFLRTNITNATGGIVDVASGGTQSDGSGGPTTFTNNGKTTFEAAGVYSFAGGSKFVAGAAGTMQFDITGPSTFGHLSQGVSFAVNGTAEPVTQGGYQPAQGTGFQVITATHSGSFSTIDNGFTEDDTNASGVILRAGPGSTTTTLTTSPNPSSFGQSLTLTAVVSGPAVDGTPSGSVTFFDGASPIVSATVTGGAGLVTATATSASLAPGTHSITAQYSGDSHFSGSLSSAVGQVVNRDPTATGLTTSDTPSVFGGPVTFTATVSPTSGAGTPTGFVTFADGSTTLQQVPVFGGSATFTIATLTPGNHSITASYGSDPDFASSASSPQSQVVTQAPTGTGLVSQQNPSSLGQLVTFVATVSDLDPNASSVNPTGRVTFTVDSTVAGTSPVGSGGTASFALSTLVVGDHSVVASYGGDANFAGSASSTLTQTVDKAASSTGLTSTPDPSSVGQPVTFTATVSGPGGTPVPAGSVTFFDSSTAIGTGSLSNGNAVFVTSSLAAGGHSITASYGGDPNFVTSTSGVLTQTVALNGTATGLTSTPNPSALGAEVTFTATVTAPGGGTPTGSVAFKEGSATLGTAPLSGGSAVFTDSALAEGSHSITAVYSGDPTFGGSASSAVDQVVNPPALTITTTTLPSGQIGSTYPGANLASAGGTAPVTWTQSGLPAGLTMTSGGAISGTPAGPAGTDNVAVTATDSGTPTPQVATKNLSITIAPATLVITSTTLPSGQIGSPYPGATMASTGGTPPVTWTGSGLPAGLTMTSGGAISGTPAGPAGTDNFTVTATDSGAPSPQVASTTVSLVVRPANLAITTTTLPNGQIGSSYPGANLASSGGTAPVAWTQSGLPAGLTMTSGGAISGTPSGPAGTDSVVVTATDSSTPTPETATVNLAITIAPATLAITTTSLPPGQIGSPYPGATLASSGGTGSVSWTQSGLPAGLTMTSGGAISGTPAGPAGTDNLTVTATDSGTPTAQTATKTLSITVSPAAVTGADKAYVAGQGSFAGGSGGGGQSFINVVNLATNSLETSIAAPDPVNSIAVSPAGTQALAVDNAGNLLVISTSTDTLTKTVDIAGSSFLSSIVFSTDGSQAYVAEEFASAILVVNTSTDTVIKTIPVAAGSGPDALAVQPGAASSSLPGLSSLLYVTNSNSNNVEVVNTGTGATVATIPVAHTTDAVAVNPAGTLAYVADTSGSATSKNPIGVTVINTHSNSVVTTIPFGGNLGIPTGVSVSPNGQTAWVTDRHNDVGVINAATNSLATTITGASSTWGIAVSPDGGTVYASTTTGSLDVIDAASRTIRATINIGVPSYAIALDITGPPAPLAITSSPTLPGGTVGQPYTATLAAAGGVAPYRWSFAGWSLPAGLALNPSTGVISGTPTVTGTTQVGFTVTDSSNPPQTASQQATITILPAPVTVRIGSQATFTWTVGQMVHVTFVASGGTGPYRYAITSGSVPPGLTLSPGGALNGRVGGNAFSFYTFTITATDANGFKGSQTFQAIVS
ncbi:MAG TPA: Ig-like domain repeat protein, partial [Actinomycetota bacterium]|nr:Ig-like domain repeat protein [Actinomycetota bacterium]